MTSAQPRPSGTPAEASPAAAVEHPFEVVTSSGDALRASIRVSGALNPQTSRLLRSVLAIHLRAGRRYLRVDLGETELAGPESLAALRAVQAELHDLGGQLVLDHADPSVEAALATG